MFTPDPNDTTPRRGRRHFRPEWPDEVGGPSSSRGRGGHGHHGHPGGPLSESRRGGWRGRGPRARGDVRAAILLLLEEQPHHGYELIQEIIERSSGAWAPSPGSIYPTLQALDDEGLVTIERLHGRRTASLTPEGVAHVEANRAQLGTPWMSVGVDNGPALALRDESQALRDAVRQVARVGTPDQQAAAATAITTARKELYRLLAEDGATTD